MIPLRKIGLVAAVLLFAALVCVPGVLAAGSGQEMPGNNNHQGNDQGQQGNVAQGPGPGGSQGSQSGQNSGQGNNGPGQGSSGTDNGNTGNSGADRMAGNMTQRQGQPPGNFGNMTGNQTAPGPMVLGNMTSFGPGEQFGPGNTTFCNATGDNTTGCQPFDGNATLASGNETQQRPFDNQTAPQPADGNITLPQGQPDNTNINTGTGGQNQKDADLISEFLKWLRGEKNTTT
jgi:hypothetical protein